MKSFWLSMSLLLLCPLIAGSCAAAKVQNTGDNADASKTESADDSKSEGSAGKRDVDTSIRKVDFKNFIYEPYCVGEKTIKITVKNGEYSKETKEDDYTDRFYFNVEAPTYGDMNGDNSEEAIVLSFCNTGGTGNFSEGFVYTMKSGKPALLTRIEGGDRAEGGLRSAVVENGLLVVERNDAGETGGACCPEFTVTTKYKWNGKELQKSGAETKKALYPEERVSFAKGTTKTTIKVTVDEIKRYTLGARAGQTLSVSVNTDQVTLSLIKGDAEINDDTNSFIAQLKENGNYVIQVQNTGEKPTPVTLTIEIK
jgi:hypothetical protein